MSKEYLEALKKVKYNSSKEVVEAFDIIEKGLQRLESIDNAKPSEVIKKLDDISYLVLNEIDDLKNKELWKSYFNTIKNYILKAQENEKVLEIIKEKRIDIESFYKTFIEDDFNYLDYQIMYGTYGLELLTKEEFDLLKRWLG